MTTDTGEYVVGAALKLLDGCDVIDYNVRPRGGGIAGLGEIDVIGLRFTDATAFLCEVATHLGGLEYGAGYEDSLNRVRTKLSRQKRYAETQLATFPNRKFMFWCPIVPRGRLLDGLVVIEDLVLVANGDFKAKVESLRTIAANSTADMGNPFLRMLQLLEHLRD
jgi:hypothetical protein